MISKWNFGDDRIHQSLQADVQPPARMRCTAGAAHSATITQGTTVQAYSTAARESLARRR